MRDPKVRNLVQFAAERGMVTDADVASHIHAGLRSMPTTKTYKRWNEKQTDRLKGLRDETKRAYEAALVAGEVVAPPKPTTEEIALGHPDNPSVQAARRLLERKAARAQSVKVEAA